MIKRYEEKTNKLFKLDTNGSGSELMMSINAFDPLKLKITIDEELVYGYSCPVKISGDQYNIILNLQFTSAWNFLLKDKLDNIVTVKCYYAGSETSSNIFEQQMQVVEHLVIFKNEVPEVNVRFKVSN